MAFKKRMYRIEIDMEGGMVDSEREREISEEIDKMRYCAVHKYVL